MCTCSTATLWLYLDGVAPNHWSMRQWTGPPQRHLPCSGQLEQITCLACTKNMLQDHTAADHFRLTHSKRLQAIAEAAMNSSIAGVRHVCVSVCLCLCLCLCLFVSVCSPTAAQGRMTSPWCGGETRGGDTPGLTRNLGGDPVQPRRLGRGITRPIPRRPPWGSHDGTGRAPPGGGG